MEFQNSMAARLQIGDIVWAKLLAFDLAQHCNFFRGIHNQLDPSEGEKGFGLRWVDRFQAR